MKLLYGALLIVLVASDVWTLPARSPADDAEVISVPKGQVESADPGFKDFSGVIDTGNPFLQPNPSSFHIGIASTFDDIFRRLRARIWPLTLTGDSDESVAGSGDGESVDTLNPFGLRPLTPLNTKNSNTTSTVKVVDGHKVEINETVFGDSNSLFKVRLINVRPLESGEDVAEGVHTSIGDSRSPTAPSTSSPPRSELAEDDDDNERREPLEKQPQDNEVRDIDELQSTETNETTATSPLAIVEDSALDSVAAATDKKQTVETIMAETMAELQQENEHEQEQEQEREQLHQLAAAQDADTMAHNEETEMPLPDSNSDSHNATEPESLAAIENFGDAEDQELNVPQSEQLYREREELESSDDEDDRRTPVEMSDTFNDEWATLDADAAPADPGNDLSNDIDVFESFAPVDLSNDIAVNDMAAADPNYPYNPDAELIDLAGTVQAMPKFEKLSLEPPSSEVK